MQVLIVSTGPKPVLLHPEPVPFSVAVNLFGMTHTDLARVVSTTGVDVTDTILRVIGCEPLAPTPAPTVDMDLVCGSL